MNCTTSELAAVMPAQRQHPSQATVLGHQVHMVHAGKRNCNLMRAATMLVPLLEVALVARLNAMRSGESSPSVHVSSKTKMQNSTLLQNVDLGEVVTVEFNRHRSLGAEISLACFFSNLSS